MVNEQLAMLQGLGDLEARDGVAQRQVPREGQQREAEGEQPRPHEADVETAERAQQGRSRRWS